MRRLLRRVARVLAVLTISGVVVPVAVVVTVLGSLLFLPLPAALPAPKPGVDARISHVYDVNGREIAIFRQFETSVPVNQKDIPRVLKLAVVASEDRNFYKHGGVDVRGTARALWADVRNKRYVQGGSTITQQYVKEAYTGRKRTLVRKVREAVLASQLDRQTDKDEILYRYLSRIYLGEGAYGVGAASQSYFRKPVRALTLSEAATLAGVIPAPTLYSPRDNPFLAEVKRRLVLDKMHDHGLIGAQDWRQARAQGLHFPGRVPPGQQATIVYPPEGRQPAYPYFVDYVRRYLQAKYGPDRLFKGGLRVQTTLDPRLQAAAEQTVAATLAGTVAPLEMSLVAVEPRTGYVKAIVGGRDFNASQVNLALGPAGGGSGRQPGSSFKPFVLASAFEQGFSPTKVYAAPNAYRLPGCTGPKCTIHNYEGASYGRADLRKATVKSINTVYAQLVRDVGIGRTAELAHRLGLSTVDPTGKGYAESFALGSREVSPLEMASAYSVFAGRGLRADPTPVVKVTDAKGRVLEDHTRPRPRRALSELVADNVTDVLRGVITAGTGTRADIGRPAAGKTGTNQAYRDAWFAGYTPTLTTAVWMGYSDSQRSLLGIKGVSRVAGGTIPARTWHDFMQQALAGVPVTDFTQPAPIQPIADQLARAARRGIDPGDRLYPSRTSTGCDGPCQTGLGRPRVTAPTTTAPPVPPAAAPKPPPRPSPPRPSPPPRPPG